MEHHPLHRDLRVEHLEQVPCDGLALAVLVGRQVELLGLPQQLPDVRHLLLLVRRDDVEGLEVVFDVDAEPGPAPLVAKGLGSVLGAGGDVPDVTDRRLHDEVGTEETLDRPGLRRGLDDDEFRAHVQPPSLLAGEPDTSRKGRKRDERQAYLSNDPALCQGLTSVRPPRVVDEIPQNPRRAAGRRGLTPQRENRRGDALRPGPR